MHHQRHVGGVVLSDCHDVPVSITNLNENNICCNCQSTVRSFMKSYLSSLASAVPSSLVGRFGTSSISLTMDRGSNQFFSSGDFHKECQKPPHSAKHENAPCPADTERPSVLWEVSFSCNAGLSINSKATDLH